MTFNSEWARLVSEARERRPVPLRLAEAGPGPGGEPELVVHQDDLGAVGNEAFRLHGDLKRAADLAGAGAGKGGAGSTARAAAELSARNLTMGSALSTTLEVWDSQVKTVLQMCAHLSNHLDYSKKAHARDEAEIAASMRHRDGAAVSVSEISAWVK